MSKSFMDRRREQLKREGYDTDTLRITKEMLENPDLLKIHGVWALTKTGWVKKPAAKKLED